MKLLRSFLIFCATLALFLVAFNDAASGIWGLPQRPTWAALTRLVSPATLARPDFTRALGNAGVLLVLLIWLLSAFLWRRRPHPFQLRTPEGELLLIHPAAVIKFVHLQVESHPAVISHKVKVRQKAGRALSIAVMVYVQPMDSLPNIKRQVEQSIRSGFSRVLGIDKIEELTIVIGLDDKTISHRPGPAGTPEPKPEPPLRAALEPEPAPPAPAAPPDGTAPGARALDYSLDHHQTDPAANTPNENTGKY